MNKLEQEAKNWIKEKYMNSITATEYQEKACSTAIFPKESSITPRYKQLINKGLVYRDGTTRKGSMGRSQIVNFIVKEQKKS